MCKSEIFAEIITLVSKETEIPSELITGASRVTEIVNARYILVYLLCEKGFYPSQISSLIHKTKRSVNYIINAFQSGNQAVLTQIADCCCKTQNAITTMGYENQLAMCNQTNALVNTANQNTLSLRDGATANTNAILAKLDAMQNQALQDRFNLPIVLHSEFFPYLCPMKIICFF